jgi:hypothetical protein
MGNLFTAPASATGSELRMAIMTDDTNVLPPPNKIRRMRATDDFAGIIHAPAKNCHYQDCTPLWPHYGDELQQHQRQQQHPSHQRRASHRRLHSMVWTDTVTSRTQAYPSHSENNGSNRRARPQKFEQLSTNTLCHRQRKSRTCDYSSHDDTLHAQRYPLLSSSSSKGCYNDHIYNQYYPLYIVPSHVCGQDRAEAKFFSCEDEEYDDSCSLEYSSDEEEDDASCEDDDYDDVCSLEYISSDEEEDDDDDEDDDDEWSLNLVSY